MHSTLKFTEEDDTSKGADHAGAIECSSADDKVVLMTISNKVRMQLHGMHIQQMRTNSPDIFLRKGHWTVEEDAYIDKMISLFTSGLLRPSECPLGTSLRAYLARRLYCNPLRITKKFKKMGKKVYKGFMSYLGLQNQDTKSSDKQSVDIEAEYGKALAEAAIELNAAADRFLAKIESEMQIQLQMLQATPNNISSTVKDSIFHISSQTMKHVQSDKPVSIGLLPNKIRKSDTFVSDAENSSSGDIFKVTGAFDNHKLKRFKPISTSGSQFSSSFDPLGNNYTSFIPANASITSIFESCSNPTTDPGDSFRFIFEADEMADFTLDFDLVDEGALSTS